MGDLRLGADRSGFSGSGPGFGRRRPEFGDLSARLDRGKCRAQGHHLVRVSRHEDS
ncbi:hypothetical protein GLUCOINTEAF2_0204181 [Komagataeibacter intermedius AF2]|uniref:Uncharacterized protein n=1 Tax=Komagataeibacter intermedius AF2 TaxID=1458464 RepID=A0A0N1N516_9PROT|nr:hypothetical protein GLUCOINTEAF2_0204181 [Komagataeibacter intermedius AF2]